MYVGYVYAISIRLLADVEDANEITSKIFVEAWKTISMVRRDSPYILWLKAIAVYSSLQKIREKGKDKKNIHKQKPSRKGLGFLDQEITSLPETERIVFVLNDIEHYKKEEIADLLSMTPENVDNSLVNAREILKKTLIIKSNEALDRAIKELSETIDPHENLYDRISDNMSKLESRINKKKPEVAQDNDNKNDDGKSKQEKKRFSFKDLFKKKE